MEPIQPQQFVAGAESGIVPKILETSGQYDTWLPDEEAQYREGFDNFGCVSESGQNDIETIINWKYSHGLIPPAALKFLKDNRYIDPLTNKLNLSDRWMALVSGTTQNGNSLPAVGDALHNIGPIPEWMWPWPTEIVAGMSQQEAWNIYYKVPANFAAMTQLAKKFLAFFPIGYEWVVIYGATQDPAAAIKAALEKGPVQFVTKVCPPWNSNEAMPPIPACGVGTGHATEGYGYLTTGSWKDFDTYKSYRKLLASDYDIPYVFQYHVQDTPDPVPPAAFHYVYNVNLKLGDPLGLEVHKLQEGLQYLGYMKAGVFGAFGPATQAALKAFQEAHGVIGNNGVNFGPKSRAEMNKLTQ